MTNRRGDAYKIERKAENERGCILETWAVKTTFAELEAKQDFSIWLTEGDGTSGWFYINCDLIQEGSMSAPAVIGVFIPNTVDKKLVADDLRKVWGPGTKLWQKDLPSTAA